LERAGGSVTVASTSKSTARGMFGATANPDITIDNVRMDDYDAVVFVGGSGSEVYFNNSTALNIAKEAHTKNKLLTAICIAPSILANANLLKDIRATVWAGEKYINILRQRGAKYTGESVTQDGRIITANGPEAARKFGKAIVQNL
jgi:protease I